MRIGIVIKCITKKEWREFGPWQWTLNWIVTKCITKKEWREFGPWQWTLNWIVTKCITKKEWREFGPWQWTLNWIVTKCITKKEWREFGPWQWTHYTEFLTHPRTRGWAGRMQWSVSRGPVTECWLLLLVEPRMDDLALKGDAVRAVRRPGSSSLPQSFFT